MGQHVDSQDLDVTKASHCTGSVSSALASGDAGEADTGPDRRVQRGVHSSINKNLRQVKRADPQRVKRAQPIAGKDQQVTVDERTEDPG